MPKEDNKPVTAADIMANLKLPVVDKNPAAPAPPTATQAKAGYLGAVRTGDGEFLHTYLLDGRRLVLPKKIEEMTEQDFFDMPITMSDPMIGRMPQDLSVKFHDPQWAGYWFNKKAKDGQRVGVARALGFVPAKIEDLEWYAPHLNDKDGALENYDLVLMKIHKAKLFMKLKEWIDKAKIAGGIASYKEKAAAFVPETPGHLEFYH